LDGNTPEQTAQIAAIKQVIYEGLKAAVSSGVPQEKAGILVDEQFSAAILRDAAKEGFMTACPAEKSAQDEFDFEFGKDFAEHIEKFNPGLGALQPGALFTRSLRWCVF
jgi:5-dehydro-2-deoxygluconokinase